MRLPDGLELTDFLCEKIVIEIIDEYDILHEDDTDHFHSRPFKVRGVLRGIYEKGIALAKCDDSGYLEERPASVPVNQSFFPFSYFENTGQSRTTIQISSIESD